MYNVIEDRFIDNYVYKNAIGYRGYYVAFYEKYFYNSIIDSMLQSNMYRVPTIDAYVNRIINMMNKNTDLTALPALKQIYDLLDLKNVEKFSDEKLKFDTACKMTKIILTNIESCGTEMMNDSMYSYNSQPKDGGAIPVDEKLSVHELEEIAKNNITKDNKQISVKSDMGDISDKTFKEVMDIKKTLDIQKELLVGKVEKFSITKQQHSVINNIEKCGVRIVMIGDGLFPAGDKKIECIFVEKLTKSLIESPAFPLSDKIPSFRSFSTPGNEVRTAVESGIRMGNVMGKKLRIRNEMNMSKFLRKPVGKIDKRLLAEIGTGNDDIFYQYKINSYDKISLHVSVDSSGSMEGEKWNTTIALTTAICKAADMLDNFDVSVSFRSAILTKKNHSYTPYVIYAYDSRVDKFSKIKQLFPMLRPSGCTPEGLAFEPILDYLDGENLNKDKYFINISDGEPFLIYKSPIGNVDIKYTGNLAAEHTRNQVNKIKNRGYNILSYYISADW
jgi:hypothetical protein